MYKFPSRFHWSLFPRVQSTIFQHWFRQWLGAVSVTKQPSSQPNQSDSNVGWASLYCCLGKLHTTEPAQHQTNGLCAAGWWAARLCVIWFRLCRKSPVIMVLWSQELIQEGSSSPYKFLMKLDSRDEMTKCIFQLSKNWGYQKFECCFSTSIS